jgi:dCTP deaminase
MSMSTFLEPLIQRVRGTNNQDLSSRKTLSLSMSEASLLSDHDIKRLIKSELLKIEPYSPCFLNSSSIDLCLGSIITKYAPQKITIGQSNPEAYEIDISDSSYVLEPGEFVLGTTKEKVYIPDGYLGVIETKGNIARAGMQVHSNDGHIDPGFCGHITLEIVNLHKDGVRIELVPGTRFCQLFIGKLSSSCDSLYKGKYLSQVNPTIHYP